MAKDSKDITATEVLKRLNKAQSNLDKAQSDFVEEIEALRFGHLPSSDHLFPKIKQSIHSFQWTEVACEDCGEMVASIDLELRKGLWRCDLCRKKIDKS